MSRYSDENMGLGTEFRAPSEVPKDASASFGTSFLGSVRPIFGSAVQKGKHFFFEFRLHNYSCFGLLKGARNFFNV